MQHSHAGHNPGCPPIQFDAPSRAMPPGIGTWTLIHGDDQMDRSQVFESRDHDVGRRIGRRSGMRCRGADSHLHCGATSCRLIPVSQGRGLVSDMVKD